MVMRKVFSTVGVVVSIALLTCMASSATAASTRIKLLKRPPAGRLVLEVGESHTFELEIAKGTPFILAVAMPDAYYPGRAIIWHGSDLAHHDNSATLSLTMTAKGSTAGLPAVCDWPEPGVCWPEGVAPASIVAGVRFKKGVVVSERFDFYVVVPRPPGEAPEHPGSP
jgi:hypothetical protein